MAAPPQTWTWKRLNKGDVTVPIGLAALTAVLMLLIDRMNVGDLRLPAFGIVAILAFSQSRRPPRFALSLGAMLLAGFLVGNPYGRVLYAERTFFGVYRVSGNSATALHSLYHGTTLHGVQSIDSSRQDEPLTYYHWTGPFGQAFAGLTGASQGSNIAVIGLGVGSLATYAKPGQQWTFYEIDPAVERIARNTEYFTHLRECGPRCRVVLGDARLSLSRAEPGKYALLVVDAFTSDAIPIHLMTREALSLYLSRLVPRGLLAFHISNRHLALGPVLARLAHDLDLTAIDQLHDVDTEGAAAGRRGSHWVVMTRDPGDLEPLMRTGAWSRSAPLKSTPLWTDDFSDILSVLAR
jgi:hypothetical protein